MEVRCIRIRLLSETGYFKRRKLGERLVAWRESDLIDWLERRETRGVA